LREEASALPAQLAARIGFMKVSELISFKETFAIETNL
jgi:hypothetical protein